MRQKETEQNQMLQDGNRSANSYMDAVRAESRHRHDRGQDNSWRSRKPQPQRRSNNVPVKTVKSKCTRGKAAHTVGDRCPASTEIFHKCNKKATSQYLKTAQTNELTVDSVGDSGFLRAINSKKEFFW